MARLRRFFTDAQKQRLVDEYLAAPAGRGIDVLKKHRLESSAVTRWMKELGMAGRRRAGRGPDAAPPVAGRTWHDLTPPERQSVMDEYEAAIARRDKSAKAVCEKWGVNQGTISGAVAYHRRHKHRNGHGGRPAAKGGAVSLDAEVQVMNRALARVNGDKALERRLRSEGAPAAGSPEEWIVNFARACKERGLEIDSLSMQNDQLSVSYTYRGKGSYPI